MEKSAPKKKKNILIFIIDFIIILTAAGPIELLNKKLFELNSLFELDRQTELTKTVAD